MIEGFPANYRFEILRESSQPTHVPHFYYPGGKESGGHDGLLVRFEPKQGTVWIGTFAFGDFSSELTGVYATPSTHQACVLASGAGYFVNINEPSFWELADCLPVTDIRPIPENDLIVLASYTDLVAYSNRGLKWKSPRIAWDDLKVTEVSKQTVRGECWDHARGELVEFEVDLTNGHLRGGAEFPNAH